MGIEIWDILITYPIQARWSAALSEGQMLLCLYLLGMCILHGR